MNADLFLLISLWMFQNGTMSKMSKFEIELPVVPKPAKLSLSERDIAMATMYTTRVIH